MSASAGPDKARPFEVGSFRVDPGLDRLLRGSESIALEPRAMDLLVCLAQRAGETVSKEVLLEEVWKGAFVIEGVIPKTLSALRAALGDDAAAPEYILTVPRRGYRLVAPVRWLPEPQREAALESATAPDGHRSEGLPTPTPPAEPAADPRKATVTARRRSGLLAAGMGFAVAGALAWILLPEAEPPDPGAALGRPVVSESVSRLLLEARHLWGQRGIDSVGRAADLMEQAVKEAPDSAEAHAWLALSIVTRASYLGGGSAACDRAAKEARIAIDLDPDDPIALCARGVMAIQKDFDAKAAVFALERSVALDPTFVPARQFLAEALAVAHQNERALSTIDQALALEPLSALLHGVRGNILLQLERPLAALEAYERVLVLEPQFTWVHRNRARPLVQLGREREAVESLYTETRLSRERPEFLATLRSAIDREGLAGYYRWRRGRIEAMNRQGFEPRPFPYGEALAGSGETEAALVELSKAPVCPDFDSFFYGRESPAFDALRDDPRFIALYARYGL